MKKVCLFLLLGIMMAVGGVFAHDAGDLMLNIEPQIGFAIPDIWIWDSAGHELSDVPYGEKSAMGGDFALRGTFHYYFFGFIGINAGLGLSFTYISYTLDIPNVIVKDYFYFGEFYVNIPFGLRFSMSAFTLGGGMTYNIPIMGFARYYDGHSSFNDNEFKLNPYLGWYADIGFDLSGINGRSGGFGLLVRGRAPFSNQIASPKGNYTDLGYFEYKPFSHVAISLVFQAAKQLASLPIGGKRGGGDE